MVAVKQGDVFWIHMPEPYGSSPGYRHPHVIIQNDAFNASRISTVVACAITSNLKLAAAPGNVALRKNEANLPKRSVVKISQIATVDKHQLVEKIGTLSGERLEEVLSGLRLIFEPQQTV